VNPFRYWMPTEIVFGAGSLDALGDQMKSIGHKPLIVTGQRSARASGALDRAMAQCPEADVFEGVAENPTDRQCDEGAERCRSSGCDCVVAIGGGSAIDAAKAIAGLARNPEPCATYLAAGSFGRPPLPIVAIPTTAGTGSETTPYAVIVDSAARCKRTIRGLFPAVALLDPSLAAHMPRHVTINTGLDALSQAMEGMVSKRATPLGDELALAVCRIVREWLPRSAEDPGNLEARGWMLYAAMLSGCVIAQSGTTLVHGMGYYFTLHFGVAHGLANALLLAPLFQYNADVEPHKVSAIAGALGYPADPVPDAARHAVAEALRDLFQRLRLSSAAKDAGVGESALRGFAEDIFSDRSRFKNQPGEPTQHEVYGFFRQAFEGF